MPLMAACIAWCHHNDGIAANPWCLDTLLTKGVYYVKNNSFTLTVPPLGQCYNIYFLPLQLLGVFVDSMGLEQWEHTVYRLFGAN